MANEKGTQALHLIAVSEVLSVVLGTSTCAITVARGGGARNMTLMMPLASLDTLVKMTLDAKTQQLGQAPPVGSA